MQVSANLVESIVDPSLQFQDTTQNSDVAEVDRVLIDLRSLAAFAAGHLAGSTQGTGEAHRSVCASQCSVLLNMFWSNGSARRCGGPLRRPLKPPAFPSRNWNHGFLSCRRHIPPAQTQTPRSFVFGIRAPNPTPSSVSRAYLLMPTHPRTQSELPFPTKLTPP